MGNCEVPMSSGGPQIAFLEVCAPRLAAGVSRRAAMAMDSNFPPLRVLRGRAYTAIVMRGRGLIAVIVTAWLSLAGGTTVAVADNGVHYDPDSPSGQEYALPLDDARGQAGGGGGGSDQSSGTAPFGQGVKPPPSNPPAAPSGPSVSGSSGGTGDRNGSGGDRSGNRDRNGDSGVSTRSGGSASVSRPEVTTASVQTLAAQTGLLIALAAVLAAAVAAVVGRRLFRRDASV